MSSPLTTKTTPLYQKHGQKYSHTDTISSLQALSSFPQPIQSLFKPPPESENSNSSSQPFILTTPSTIFHAQGGGQPSDTGTFTSSKATFHVHQVRKVDPTILHMGVFDPAEARFDSSSAEGGKEEVLEVAKQEIDIDKRILHSRLHTAGHVIGLAVSLLVKSGHLPDDIIDGKASHYPGAAFVEFAGLIPGTAKAAIQDQVHILVAQDLDVKIHFWDEQKARKECTGVLESFKSDEDGVRVVEIGDVGSYPCGGTHVVRLKQCGEIVIRNIKRQKGISKVSYEVK